jgi:hypothetical protein
MWMTDPLKMCNQHLLGEHVEHHMLVGQINRRRRLDGYAANGLIEPRRIRERHDALAAEMIRRGFRHQSLLDQPGISYLPAHIQTATVDPDKSIKDLCARCQKCRLLVIPSVNEES